MTYPFQPGIFGSIPQFNNQENLPFGSINSYQQPALANENILIEKLRNELPPTFTRKFICEKLGGLLAPKSLANLDSLCEGPECKIRIGKKIGYERDSFLSWFEKRIKK